MSKNMFMAINGKSPVVWTIIFCCQLLLGSCRKEETSELNLPVYNGVYSNYRYSESLIKEFEPGIYTEKEIPSDIQQLKYGRIEVNFRYNGGGEHSFMPLFYYGSTNKNLDDNHREAPKFHLAIEIGHYNVIPNAVDYFFYTICTYNYPRYCRDSFSPVETGANYTFVMDKRPDGIFLQMKKGDTIVNSFPHAYFPDSTQMFFSDVSRYTEANKGDSLQKVLMVGYGFAGIEPGLHQFNGNISGLKIYKYFNIQTSSGYELGHLHNQQCEGDVVKITLTDKNAGSDKYVQSRYNFWPYKYLNGNMVPTGVKKTIVKEKVSNGSKIIWEFKNQDIGLYHIQLQTYDNTGKLLNQTEKPFEVWVYPKEWKFQNY